MVNYLLTFIAGFSIGLCLSYVLICNQIDKTKRKK